MAFSSLLILGPLVAVLAVLLSAREGTGITAAVTASVLTMFVGPVFLLGYTCGAVFLLRGSFARMGAGLWFFRLVMVSAAGVLLLPVMLDYPYRSPAPVVAADALALILALGGFLSVAVSLRRTASATSTRELDPGTGDR